ncbi:MAG: carbamoyltransferase HypF [Candidatus Bathyarchaeota archaeon]|nr:carbamoyltransferase HypF [Candidatus Bathyarchaeum tardum]WNZ30077.1 MAG: carbamoyltransferase HypF [Candidatus Bathyarchaeota archaeon]
MRAEILVSGIVQGVGFRPFIYRTALNNKLTGFVRNRGDAGVKIVLEGKQSDIKQFLKDLETKNPVLAQLYNTQVNYKKQEQEFTEFKIIKSSRETELSGSVIPPDVSICDECLQEMRAPKNRRFNYFFTTCTDCGPRYTIINSIPYDRSNTTMNQFPMCEACTKEYSDPSNRRFHAQTVACLKCGPKVYLVTNKGEPIDSRDPIRETGRLLEEGNVVAIKGNGGFHVATSTINPEPIAKLRKDKHRKNKPFGVMAPDLETVRTFAELNQWETELLISCRKPIVLLKKSPKYYLSELVSPQLHTLGVMLPYTGLHAMLFDQVKEPAFVMTSANPPSEPIVIDNNQAIQKLGKTVEYFLMHNRALAKRCDDSVVRFHGKDPSLIRRSRGYVPEPVQVKFVSDRCVLAVGGELNVTSCILSQNRAFISQHIGDVENIENLRFLKDSITHLTKLTNCKIGTVACDLHPRFTTTKLAQDLAAKLDCPVVQVQHHHAHAAALMAEWETQEVVAITCDGYGYGSDGSAWGGEVLYSNNEGSKRLANLEPQPIVGGDLATYHPLRIAAGILNKKMDITDWLISSSNHLPHGKVEAELIIKQLEKGTAPTTTSCGRVLDAVSALLGICYERSYEGEPAMKLESVAAKGKDVLKLVPKIKDNVLDTAFMVHEIFSNKAKVSLADLACSAQSYLGRGLGELAVKHAEQLKVKDVGFSGGVAYNEHITATIRKTVENAGFRFLVHNKIPAGDGGTSFGQAVVAGLKQNQ